METSKLAGLATECAADGEPFTLSGCVPIPCLSSTKAQDTGYVVYLGGLDLKNGPKFHGPRGRRGPKKAAIAMETMLETDENNDDLLIRWWL